MSKKVEVRVKHTPCGMHPYTAHVRGQAVYGWGKTPIEARERLALQLANEVAKFTPIVRAARRLHDFLHANAGTTADWPVDLIARDENSAQTLVELLGTLRKSLNEEP